MVRYQYSALKNNKEVITGELDANSLREARQEIRDLGFTPLKVFEPDLENSSLEDEGGNAGGISFLSLSDKILFVSELQVMIGSGISMLEALQTLESHAINRKLKMMAHAIQGEIMKGRTFSEAINYLYHDIFGEIFLDLCITGENTGELPRTFDRMLTMLRKQDEIKGQIIQALIYPCILVFMMLGVLIFFAKVVFPKFMAFILTNGGSIPPLSQAVMDLMTFVGSYWYLCIIGLFGICGAIFFLASNEYSREFFDRILVKIPIVKDFVNYINLSNYMCIMSISYECGVPFTKSILLAEKSVSNCVVKERAKNTTVWVSKGVPFSEALEKAALLPASLITMIAAGEKAGNLTKMMKDCVEVIDKKVNMVLSALTKAFEPAMLIGLGGMVLLLAMAFFQMYLSMITSL